MSLSIKNLSSNPSLFEDFANFGEKIRSEQTKIGVLSPERILLLIQWGLHHQSEFWIIFDENLKIVMRIGAHYSLHRKNEGAIGFFEADLEHNSLSEAFNLAITTAEDWLKKNNVLKVQAPLDINTWFNYRFSKPSKDKFRFKFEPTTPPEYEELFRQKGYKDHSYYHSVAFPYIKILFFIIGMRGFRKTHEHLLAQGFSHRPMNFEKFETDELPFIYDLVHKEFSETVLFEPIEFDVFKMLYASALTNYDFSPSCILLDPNKKPAGFLFAFYEKNHLVIKSIAIKKDYQGLKLASGMIYQAVKKSQEIPGMKACISALVRSGIKSEKIENSRTKNVGLAWKHEYILLEKELK
jgi:ribosomal protein S18 acetylase RimI-like enzyme